MHALIATDVTRRFGDRAIIDDLSLTAPPGRRLGLVGDNGSGKSTLLRLLAGHDDPDSGTIQRPAHTALLEQELPHPPDTTIDAVVEEALAELRELARNVQELAALVQRIPDDPTIASEYGDALDQARLRGAWDADHRVSRVMRGLGLERFPRSRELGSLSGGERARVAMAALLVRQPEALLMDEPTNHLDDAGVAFLERHLQSLPGVLVVASHDRAFLDAVCSDIVDIDPARDGVTRFGGSFTDYLAAKRRDRVRWEHAWRAQQHEVEALERSLDNGSARTVAHNRPPRDSAKMSYDYRGSRVQATVARRVRSTRARIEQLERSAIARPPDPLRFQVALGAHVDDEQPLVVAESAAFAGRIGPHDLVVAPGSRLLVSGPNGVGKSTLLAMLAGELRPTTGSVDHVEGLRIGYLRQETPFAPNETPHRLYRVAVRGNAAAPALAELGLLRDDDLERPMGELSEGQRRRVALALLVARAPHLLLLDEPTNHLSPTLVSELEDALAAAPAAVVIVSHDRWLRSRWSGPELRLLAAANAAGAGVASMH